MFKGEKFYLAMVSLLCLVIFSACAPRKYIVDLNPNAFKESYVKENALSSVTPKINFSQGEFTDSRADKTAFGRSKRYIILTENEFSTAFFDGLEEYFTSSGQNWSDVGSGDIKINVELLETQSEMITGFWVVNWTSTVITKLTFVDIGRNESIYQQTYTGKYDFRSPVGHESIFKRSVNQAIVDCINKIGEDQALKNALTNRQ